MKRTKFRDMILDIIGVVDTQLRKELIDDSEYYYPLMGKRMDDMIHVASRYVEVDT
jgi:hypothetical protein